MITVAAVAPEVGLEVHLIHNEILMLQHRTLIKHNFSLLCQLFYYPLLTLLLAVGKTASTAAQRGIRWHL